MNTTKKIQAVFMLSAAAMVATVLPAQAAVDSTLVSLTVTGGALTIDIPNASYALSGVTLGAAATNSTASIPSESIIDTRGSLAGWASNYKLSNLAGQTDNTKNILLASASPIIGGTVQYLTATTSNPTVVASTDVIGDLTVYNSAQTITSLSGLTGAGESNNFNLLDAPSGFGAGSFSADIGISLDIPAFGQYPGTQNITAQNYQGTLTASVS